MQLSTIITNLRTNVPTIKDATRSKNIKVLMRLLGPAYRNLILQRAKQNEHIRLSTSNNAFFDWSYERDKPELGKLYDSAKKGQWNGDDGWRIF